MPTTRDKEHLTRMHRLLRERFERTFWTRFWNRVNKNAPNECWEWTGTVNTSGYGQVRRNGRSFIAHRLMFQEQYGPIPDGMQVCHRCDNPPCVNPGHLFLGTARDNVDDCISKNRRRYRHGDVPKRQGENNGRAKLTEALVRELRTQDWSKFGARSAKARELGVAVGSLTAALSGRTWRNVV